jgi:hypothetical protein
VLPLVLPVLPLVPFETNIAHMYTIRISRDWVTSFPQAERQC